MLSYLRWIAIALVSGAVVTFGLSIFFFYRARIGEYYIIRESARKKGLLWFLATVGLLIAWGVTLYLQAHPPQGLTPATTPTPTPTVTSTISPATLIPLATATPTAIPSPTPTREATATPPFIPTPTPAYPLPEEAVTRLEGAVPAAPESQITFVTFAADVENGRPVDPGIEFQPGDHRIYFFFDYRDMTVGSTWTYAWYDENGYLDGNTCPWGVQQENCPRIMGTTGSNYLFFRPPGGYESGIYEVRVWIEERIQATAQFVITASQ